MSGGRGMREAEGSVAQRRTQPRSWGSWVFAAALILLMLFTLFQFY